MLVGFCYKGSYSTGRFWTHILIPVFTLFSGYFISSKNIPGYLHFLYTLNPIRICLENIIIVIFNREDKRNKLKEYGFHNSKYRIIWNVLLLSLLSCILRLIGFYFQKRRLRPLRIESKDGNFTLHFLFCFCFLVWWRGNVNMSDHKNSRSHHTKKCNLF
jgi:hypothetical protein